MTFAAFAMSHGLIVKDVYPSDKIKRCPTEAHPRSDNGAYFYDGQRGWVYLHDGEAKTIWWNDQNVKPWSDAEKREWAAKKRQAEQAREDGYRRAAATAATILRGCKPAEHPYLSSKQLPSVLGLVNDDHALFVPMRNLTNNELVGGQTIQWQMDARQWQKKMIYGMRAKAAVFRLGSARTPETWLVEGYATGLTLELALRRMCIHASVLVCFSANNLTHVAPMVQGRKFVFADHDKSGTGEASAKATGLPYCMSEVEGEDANDLYARAGIFAVCKQVMAARQMEMA
jgi:phage/plasmid primase-like uncharacterized protein